MNTNEHEMTLIDGLALLDESTEVRLLAVPLVGSLSTLNPAVALPMLRRLLLTLRRELGADPPAPLRSTTRRRREEPPARATKGGGRSLGSPGRRLIDERQRQEGAARLLRLLSRHCPRLLRTYCAPILQTLLTRLRTTLHAPTASELLLALGAGS